MPDMIWGHSQSLFFQFPLVFWRFSSRVLCFLCFPTVLGCSLFVVVTVCFNFPFLCSSFGSFYFLLFRALSLFWDRVLHYRWPWTQQFSCLPSTGVTGVSYWIYVCLYICLQLFSLLQRWLHGPRLKTAFSRAFENVIRPALTSQCWLLFSPWINSFSVEKVGLIMAALGFFCISSAWNLALVLVIFSVSLTKYLTETV